MSIVFTYILNILFLAGISFWYYQKVEDALLKRCYWPAMIFKITCGFILGTLFYEFYGFGDTIAYYNQATKLVSLDLSNFITSIFSTTVPSQPVRAIYFVRLVAVLKWLTHADYWMLSIYFSLFSFIGSFYLIQKIANWNDKIKISVLISFSFFPSVVFWSSGLLKESLVFGAVGFLLGVFLSWYSSRKLSARELIIGIPSFFLLVVIKYYIAAVLIPVLVYLIVYSLSIWENKGIKNIWAKTGLILILMAIPMLVFLAWLSPNLTYSGLWTVMQLNHQDFILLAPEGTLYILTWFENRWDVLINIPYLWFSGIFRPLLGESFTFPTVIAGIENLLLFGTVIWSFILAWKRTIKWSPELLALLAYVSVLSIFLSYSVPNFGTLARFKIYYIPFVALLAIIPIQQWIISKKN